MVKGFLTSKLLCCRFSVGDEVSVEIDGPKRMLHARIHSAGHLLDTAFANIGVTYLEPSKVRPEWLEKGFVGDRGGDGGRSRMSSEPEGR